MVKFLLAISLIIFCCILLNRFSHKIGVPVLLLFIFLGIMYGLNVGQFNQSESRLVENVCTVALIFIMFYGGFGTNWKSARPVAVEAGILATLGVFMTAGLTGLFCHFALGWNWLESLLMGSVISSTDAATVFSILRGKRMGLKNNTAPLLEIESGSNDPCSYMLTALFLGIIEGTTTGSIGLAVGKTIFCQIVFGAACGLIIAQASSNILKRFNLSGSGYDMLFIFAVAILSYALPSMIGGNGYLSTYIVGIILGNQNFQGRKQLVPFFDGVTSLMQILIFFLLGYMSQPALLLKAFIPALIIFLFMTLVARPLSVGSILLPFRKYPMRQIGLISFVGLRGAASIVFSIMILSHGVALNNDIFSIVFCIVLISILLQGSLIPAAARIFKMIDDSEDVMKTFTDYSESDELSFGEIEISEKSNWNNTAVKDLKLPENTLIPLIIRGKEHIVPNGSTTVLQGDKVITCTKSFSDKTNQQLYEHEVHSCDKYDGIQVKDMGRAEGLLLMIKRGSESIIPNGRDHLHKGDILIFLKV